MEKQNLWQFIKFTLFSLSAGVIQLGSYALLDMALKDWRWFYSIKPDFFFETPDAYRHAVAYFISLVLSVVWNFTFNRRFTFKSAANIPIAMLKVAGFYLVFTPLSLWLGGLAVDAGVNNFLVEILTMTSNLILEYLYCKFVVYRGKENTREQKA
ncbi:MAG: GtrA family protein [Clostridia bacterium]|nr:GtrA family protein [Clostridia bacterium]